MTCLVILGSWQAITGMAACKSANDKNPDFVICITRINEQSAYEELEKYFAQNKTKLLFINYTDFQSGFFNSELISIIDDCQKIFLPLTPLFFNSSLLKFVCLKNVSFYEDGLHSLASLEQLRANSNTLRIRRSVLETLRIARGYFKARKKKKTNILNINQIHRYWGILSPINCVDSFKEIKRNEIDDEIEKFSRSNSVNSVNSKKSQTLILGSNFSMYGFLSADLEYTPVCEFIEKNDPSETLYWKPHPRASKLYTEYLLTKYPNLHLWPSGDKGIPLECWLGAVSNLRLVSVMSTSLVYAKQLFNLEVRLLGDITQPLQERGQELSLSYNYLRKNVKALELDSPL